MKARCEYGNENLRMNLGMGVWEWDYGNENLRMNLGMGVWEWESGNGSLGLGVCK